MKIHCLAETNGRGLWSTVKRVVHAYKMQMNGFAENWDDGKMHGELRVFFTKRSWNITVHGLIYTDDKWLTNFRKYLREIGFSNKAVREVDYSEQGMQGENYISLDIGDTFIRELAQTGERMYNTTHMYNYGPTGPEWYSTKFLLNR